MFTERCNIYIFRSQIHHNINPVFDQQWVLKQFQLTCHLASEIESFHFYSVQAADIAFTTTSSISIFSATCRQTNKFYLVHSSQCHRVRQQSQFSSHSCSTWPTSRIERIITRSVKKHQNKYLYTNSLISTCTVVGLPSSVESATSKKVIIMVHQWDNYKFVAYPCRLDNRHKCHNTCSCLLPTTNVTTSSSASTTNVK